MSTRDLVRHIRAVVKTNYNYWVTYNDANKDHRRIKFMTNGAKYDEQYYQAIDKAIKAQLAKENIVVQTAGWETLWRNGYGMYVAYIVRIAK